MNIPNYSLMLKANNLSKNYGSITVLSDISFSLEVGQRVALVGYNGTGKSTLLKIFAGLEVADSGSYKINKNTRIGYLPQDTSLSGDETILNYFKRVSGIGDALVHKAEVMLSGFGLQGIGSDRLISSLSSGQKSKIALIGILLLDADLLLLDEPTNNLDLPALIWLEDFLISSKAAAIVISHDRKFLDNVTTKIFELDWQTHNLTVTNGNYSDYLKMVAKRRERQKEAYLFQQEEIERLSKQAEELKKDALKGSHWPGWDKDKMLRGFKRDRAAGSARGAKSLEKQIEQMEKIEKPIARRPLEIPLEFKRAYRDTGIKVKGLIFGYPGKFSVGPISLDIEFGNRVGILGLNGSGKSTLLKTLSGYIPAISGEIHVGSGIKIGDMMQEHDSLPREVTLLDHLMARANIVEQDAYAILGRFRFDAAQMRREISVLSPGGRARFILALFSIFSVNTLILDEPTNHLDLEAMDALEEALESYAGTVIVTSHDREFLKKMDLDQIFLIENGTMNKIKDLQTYILLAEDRARRLLGEL